MDQTIMTRLVTRPIIALVLAGAGLCALTGATAAQPRPAACPEGRLADGGCVNPRLAFLARQQAVCYSQFKLSYIACPGTLPAVDTRYKFPWNVLTERQTELNFILER
ncbi:hypothetical protein FF100_20600 [Methylobacterium terricola]|uniref:YARHG domain-containing protein n=1 Tax=Methylobacterium terricola TaxID=2583531 RepID=A0A5C4LED2_9HYPH|nr:hypothetical protein [Methylobacterium terricola]TNC11007.1 hypothetical protein FF100_20600 [Methylobacterium terricola]